MCSSYRQTPHHKIHYKTSNKYPSNSYMLIPIKYGLPWPTTAINQIWLCLIQYKWNKCTPSISTPNGINAREYFKLMRLKGLNYGEKMHIHQYDLQSCPTPPFSQRQLQSIRRSDYYFCANDFISYQLKQAIKTKNYIINSIGVPVNQFKQQIEELNFRAYRHRKHFAYLGNLAEENNKETISLLIEKIWPLIRKELKNVELHIIGNGYNPELTSRKKELQKNNILLKGFVQSTEEIQKYRAVLLPIRTSCSSRGAVVESWFHHTPVVTTPVGAQGMLLPTTEPLFSAEQDGKAYSGFFKQRTFSKKEERLVQKLTQYYKSNKLSEQLGEFAFGGLCNSFSMMQFASNAIDLYTKEELWNKCLLNSRKSILQNQSQQQLEVNISYGLAQIEYGLFQNRKRRQYVEQWGRYMNSAEAQAKLKQRHLK